MNYDHVPIPLFISCSKSSDDSQTYSDLITAYRLKEGLEKQGFTAFIYDEKIALGTEQWQTRMKELIHKTLAVICLVSPNTPETDYVNRELELVETYKRTVYPVWIAGDDWNAIVPRTLRGQRFFDVRHGQYSPTGLAELVTVLTAQYADVMPPIILPPDPSPLPISIQMLIHNLSQIIINWRKKKVPPPVRTEINIPLGTQAVAPYKGLEPFTQSDARYFFGREQLIEKIIDRIVDLTEQQPQPNREAPLRFISIVGASGSGKSSLVMAGVMSSLHKRDQHWLCLTPTRPGYDPLGKLAQTLAAFQPPRNARSVDTLTKNLRDNATSLQKLTESIAKHKKRKLILYIDQFEELFATGIDKADQELFIDRLESVARDPSGHAFVLITLRADFYAHWLDHNRLATLLEQQTITVPAMNIEQLRDVIEKPAERVGLTFEGNLVGDLLNDISRQREALPLLQFTLKKLYDRSDHRLLTTHIYEELGGVNGALDHYAEDIYQGNLPDGQSLTSDSQREMARHLFSKLIYINGSVDNATRRRATMSDFQLNDAEEHQTMQETIEVFVKARLLILDNQRPAKTTVEDPLTTTSDTPGQPLYSDTTLEISHEALIREWKSLRNWIELHQDDMHIQQNVDNASKKWKSAAEPKKHLYSGRELAKARSWATNNKPTAIQMRFIQESRKQQTKSRLVRALGVISGGLAAILIIVLIINHIVGESFVVTNTQDHGDGSLRQILSEVHDHGEIHFAPGLQGTIILNSSDLLFNKNVTIVGPDQQNIKISNTTNQRRVIIDAGKTVMLQNLVFTGSHVSASSFIMNQGDLTLSTCTIQGNNTDSNGGGISNEGGGILTIQNNTVIQDNHARRNGGGIYTQDGSVNVNNSSIVDNTSINGGGIYGLQASITINHSKIQSNTAKSGEGGGIDAIHSNLMFTTLDVEKNHSATYGGGIAINGSQATINTATISQNNALIDGGGLAVIKDTEINASSHLGLTNTEAGTNLLEPHTPHAIWNNTIGQLSKSSEQQIKDIMGKSTRLGLTINIVDDNKNYSQGSPPPSFLPETSLRNNYLGTADLDTFCQNQHFSYGSLSDDRNAPSNDIQIQCFASADSAPHSYTALRACQDQYLNDSNNVDVTDRLADFYDPSSLQCYRNVHPVGKIADEIDLRNYCKHISETLKDDQAHNTAYDWSCVNSAGQESISLTDACQYIYKNKQAFYQLVDYYDPNGWMCLAPN